MNRFMAAMAGVLIPAWMGCSNTQPAPSQGCAPEEFDVSACDVGAVSAVKAEGIWQANVLTEGLDTPGSLRLLANTPMIFNTPLTQRPGDNERFFLASEYKSGTVTRKLVLSACQASEAGAKVSGEFRRCTNGVADLKGTFEAARTRWGAGEQEASGVEWVAEAALPRGQADEIFVAGGYAYVTAGAEGLFVFDVRDPKAPQKVAEVKPSNDSWTQLWVQGPALYVASATEGVAVFDVSDPKVPKRMPALPVEVRVEALGLVVDQNRLYVMSPSPLAEVLIFDVREPLKPLLMKRYFVEDSQLNAGEVPVEGAVVDNRLYLGHWRYGVAVADVSNPNAPKTLGRFKYERASSRAIAAGALQGQTYVFEASEGWDSRVRALNVTDPAHITQVGTYQVRPQSTVSAMTLRGSKLYVSYAQEGLRILDVSNPSTPKLQAYYNTWRESDPGRGRAFIDGLSAVAVPGDGYLYAAETSRGLLVLREQ